MEDEIFFNQSKYIKEMLKKFGLEDSKPTKTPISTEIKLTKDDEADSVDSTKYQGEGSGWGTDVLLRWAKAKEETERLISKAIMQERRNIQAQISTQIENAIANFIPSQVDASIRSYMSRHILHAHPAQSQTSSVPDQQYQLNLAMKVDPQLQQQYIAIWLAL
ncbi:hypothetical protein Tco_1507363 [Tanacetum coccineum]